MSTIGVADMAVLINVRRIIGEYLRFSSKLFCTPPMKSDGTGKSFSLSWLAYSSPYDGSSVKNPGYRGFDDLGRDWQVSAGFTAVGSMIPILFG